MSKAKNGRYEEFGNVYWYKDDYLHREDGPAVEYSNGNKDWCIDGKYHRVDGPAVEFFNGDREWFLNGKRHRENGPAVEWSGFEKEWWLDGVEYSEKEFKHEVSKLQLNKKNHLEGIKQEIESLDDGQLEQISKLIQNVLLSRQENKPKSKRP